MLTFYEPLMEGRYENLSPRIEELEELRQLADRFEDRATMLADLALDPPDEADTSSPGEAGLDRLVLSTMHSAKGLEWKVVYVLHASDGKIPFERSLSDPEQVEEERRLFYVALTRAADWLYVCHPRRQASSYGNQWMGDVYERTELTRFLTKAVQSQFDCQRASTFQPPADAPPAPPGKKPRRKGKNRGLAPVKPGLGPGEDTLVGVRALGLDRNLAKSRRCQHRSRSRQTSVLPLLRR